jgi:hypothetical protein
MDGEADVGGVRAHLDRERGLRDQIAGAWANDAAADDPFARLVEQHLGQALVAA